MDLDTAIKEHDEYKTIFKNAIYKRESVDISKIPKEDCCELGKWLNLVDNKHGHLNRYKECVLVHSEFHMEANRLASLINSNDYVNSKSMMEFGMSYWLAYNKLAVAIKRLWSQAML